jgi:nitroreductase
MTGQPNAASQGSAADAVMENIRTRRVAREFTADPLTEAEIRQILTAGRWAATGGNRRIHRFLVIQSAETIRLVRAVSPGIWTRPTALVVICVDEALARADLVQIERDTTVLIDVGTAAMNMMLAAHAIGIGSCPATSFSRSGLRSVLGLPDGVAPEFILQLGRPAPAARHLRAGVRTRVTVDDLTYWERYGGSPSAGDPRPIGD